MTLDRSLEQLCRVGDPDLLHHVRAVRFDCLDTDAETLPNVLIFEAGPNEL